MFGAVSVGLGLPALPALGAVRRRLPWVHESWWQRAIEFVGGPRGVAAGGYGATLLAVGARTGKLSTEYIVFGNRLSLLALVVVTWLSGVLVYGIRRS